METKISFSFVYCSISALTCHLTLILFHVCDELFLLGPLLSQKVCDDPLFEADFVVVDNLFHCPTTLTPKTFLLISVSVF